MNSLIINHILLAMRKTNTLFILLYLFPITLFSQTVTPGFGWVSNNFTFYSTTLYNGCGGPLGISFETSGSQHIQYTTTPTLAIGGPVSILITPATLSFSQPVSNVSIYFREFGSLLNGESFHSFNIPPDQVTTIVGSVVYNGSSVVPSSHSVTGIMTWNGPITDISFIYEKGSLGNLVVFHDLHLDCPSASSSVVPTLGQWGLIILGLIILCVGGIAILRMRYRDSFA